MKLKKYLLGGLVPFAAVAPVAIALSCNETSQTQSQASAQTNASESKTSDTFDWSSVTEDGIYFNAQTIKGQFWYSQKASVTPTTQPGPQELFQMPTNGSLFAQSNVVELGDNDKFYVAFDKDDSDGLTPSDFEKELFFMDSSYGSNDEFDSANQEFGNVIVDKGDWKEINVGFKNNSSNQYLGSQSNHMGGTFDQAMASIKPYLTDDQYKAVEKYYESASKAFYPQVHPIGMFTYTKVNDRAFEITFHYDNKNPITAAAFILKPTDKSRPIQYETWSIGGPDEWSSYTAHADATYVIKK